MSGFNWTFEIHEGEKRFYLTQKGMNDAAQLGRIRDALIEARDRAKRDAIKNLARYKFSNFGYHAARWVLLNQLVGDKQPNPFNEFVALARTMPEWKHR